MGLLFCVLLYTAPSFFYPKGAKLGYELFSKISMAMNLSQMREGYGFSNNFLTQHNLNKSILVFIEHNKASE